MDTHVADDAVAILHECPPTSRVDKRVIGPHWSGTGPHLDRKSTRLNSSHSQISYAVFCLKKKKKIERQLYRVHSYLRSHVMAHKVTASVGSIAVNRLVLGLLLQQAHSRSRLEEHASISH